MTRGPYTFSGSWKAAVLTLKFVTTLAFKRLKTSKMNSTRLRPKMKNLLARKSTLLMEGKV